MLAALGLDVFAADDETVLVIECKCAEKPKEKSWKTELEAINTEIQSVKSLVDDAISSVFDWGSG